MKKSILSLMLLGGTLLMHAQTTKPGTKPATKPVTKPATQPVNILKTSKDSISYVLGEVAAFNLVNQGLGEIPINGAVFLRALEDILGKKPTLIDDVTANSLINNYMVKMQTEKIKPTIAEGEKFLAQNKLKPGVKTTASGLQYEVITEGQGAKPAVVDTFVAHYRGTLLDGTQFDASYDRGEPLVYPMNKVISGWTEGLQLMSVGSKYKFYIPYNLGYGAMGSGKIPGGAVLIFDLELLDIKKKSQ
jgi:FKBP-type peptidyl-prolyl cis-trans isomerase